MLRIALRSFLLGCLPLLAWSQQGLEYVSQVYQPVEFAPASDNGCDVEMLLMDHVFAFSYGEPFVGMGRESPDESVS